MWLSVSTKETHIACIVVVIEYTQQVSPNIMSHGSFCGAEYAGKQWMITQKYVVFSMNNVIH